MGHVDFFGIATVLFICNCYNVHLFYRELNSLHTGLKIKHIQYLPWATPVVSGHLPCTATLSMPRPTHFNVKLPLISGHLQRTDTFAWSRGCPSMTGTTVFNMKVDHKELGKFSPQYRGVLTPVTLTVSTRHLKTTVHIV